HRWTAGNAINVLAPRLTPLGNRSNFARDWWNGSGMPADVGKLPRSPRAETRARLIHVGTEILSEKGFVSTGLDEVLRRAGVPKGSFYHYFSSKADFGHAVVDNYAFL